MIADHDESDYGPAPNPMSHEGEVVVGEVVDESGRVSPDRVQITAESFRGPLPRPHVLREYDEAVPGLAREIVDQWKDETTHRHKTIDSLSETDRESTKTFYKAELVGQIIAGILFLGILAVVAYAIAEHQTAIGVAGVVAAGGVGYLGSAPHKHKPTADPTRPRPGYDPRGKATAYRGSELG